MSEFEKIETDFLVVGSGIAGLYTSLQLSGIGEVKVITKDEIKESSTEYAQGGIAAVLDKEDSWRLHKEDTLEAGDGFCDEKAVEVLVKNSSKRVKELIELGTQFDYIEGELDLAREGAHSRRRVLHARGDATGQEIRESLTKAAKKDGEIELFERMFLIDLITNEQKIRGALCWSDERERYVVYSTDHVILASGGCGMVFQNTTNPKVTTGDGVSVAYRAGAEITDMEFIQFHPTAFHSSNGSSFLISETVRGEGGLLRNEEGDRFMLEYHEDAELAPRDVVARAIVKEAKKFEKDHVWLDVTHLDDDFLRGRFPKIYQTLQDFGIKMAEDLIPVGPSAHYMIGGVKTDLHGSTNIEGLYACGEVASTGVHGANRLASNSLLEGLVFGKRIYEKIAEEDIEKERSGEFDLDLPDFQEETGKAADLKDQMRELMMDKAGIVRKEDELVELIKRLEDGIKSVEDLKGFNPEIWESKNMLQVGKFVSKSALMREESRGAHYRADHPTKNEDWKDKHIVFDREHTEGYVT
ncbi:MAG: L-aspartate oxidase [Candidatus Thermoplasmatota archaeon]|nr:L-aspartate oxidase [Candidatus Thermoplasmatota archaeon]